MRLPVSWPLLFPLTYLIHIAEEYFAAEGFPEWSARYLNFRLTPERFLELNGIAWIAVCMASLIVLWRASARWVLVPLATVTAINGCAHAVASIATMSYSPGVISGVMLWIPLGVFTLRRGYQDLSSRLFWMGIGVGIVLHGVVTVLALGS